MKALFRIVGFMPYILIMFLNAMTDLGHKIILQNTIFKSYTGSELIVLTAIVNSLILLPFIFLFVPAGKMSDKYPKTTIVKYSAALAVVITTVILFSYYHGWFWIAFGMTFLLAAQSAIYSPAKYGLIKEMVGEKLIAKANAMVQSVTIISILLGTLIYSIVFENLLQDRSIQPNEILRYIAPVGYMLIGASVLEWGLALYLAHKVALPPTKASTDQIHGDTIADSLKAIKYNDTIWLSILGLSMFWGISQVVMALFGQYLKGNLGVTNTIVVQGLLTLSGLGIIFGSIFAGKVSRDYIEAGIVPVGALGIAISAFVLPYLHSIPWLGVSIFVFGFSAGLFIVPLNSMVQFAAPAKMVGKVLAGNNFMQSIFMFVFLVLTALFGWMEVSSSTMLKGVAIIAFVGMLYTFIKMPQSLVRYVVMSMFRFRYTIQVNGLDRVQADDRGVLLLGNHISFLDWAMLQIAYPQGIRFVMDRSYYDKWYLKPFLDLFRVIPISTRGSKRALGAISDALKNGDIVALFPEGHISRNGQMSSFQRGFEKAVEGLDPQQAIIVPFYLRGLWEDDFSWASNKLKKRSHRDVSVTFGEPMDIHSTTHHVKMAVTKLSMEAWEQFADTLPTISRSWLNQVKQDPKDLAVADSTGAELTRERFAAGVFALASKLKKHLSKQQNIGIIVPTSVAGAMVNISLLSLGKTVVNLNYTADKNSLQHALAKANISTIIVSKQFITKLKAKGVDIAEILDSVDLLVLEDLKAQISMVYTIGILMLIKMLPASLLGMIFIKRHATTQTAAIVFSSGSEGAPKGVELSHINLMGNIKQTVALINPTDSDVMLGTLPMFHSFGLTATTLLPLVEGIPLACHTDPTDGYGVGKMAARYRGSILFGTATFLRLYMRNRKLHPLMFRHLRMVVAGAERLSSHITHEFEQKFGITIYEGYGATETTPVASVNIYDALLMDSWRVQVGNKPGTVGLPVPGSSFMIVDPQTFEPLDTDQEGMILIGGTQIMKGYLGEPEKTAEVIRIIDGQRWYVTGDKGRLDEDGFLTIVDRYSRFAKVGGEMVSLGMIESAIEETLDEGEHVLLVSVPDPKKGEKIVMLYEGENELVDIIDRVGSLGLNRLLLPSEYIDVDSIPRLGSGKSDIVKAQKIALAETATRSQ